MIRNILVNYIARDNDDDDILPSIIFEGTHGDRQGQVSWLRINMCTSGKRVVYKSLPVD